MITHIEYVVKNHLYFLPLMSQIKMKELSLLGTMYTIFDSVNWSDFSLIHYHLQKYKILVTKSPNEDGI